MLVCSAGCLVGLFLVGLAGTAFWEVGLAFKLLFDGTFFACTLCLVDLIDAMDRAREEFETPRAIREVALEGEDVREPAWALEEAEEEEKLPLEDNAAKGG